jgi:hypothetical protein
VKLFLNGDGTPRAQCTDTNGNGKLDQLYRLEGGQVSEGVVDTTGDGQADQMIVYEGGAPARIHVDTNGDGKADVIQYLSGGNVVRQCEDSVFDGAIDRCFEGTKLVETSGVIDLSEPLPKMTCGGFHPGWRRLR